jgi:type I restriction enzyme, S subunit
MQLIRLGDFLEVQAGFAFKTEFFTAGEGVPLIRIRDLANSRTEINYSGEYKPDFVVSTGDYLIGMDGNFRCYRWQGDRSLLNQRVCRLRSFREGIEPEYVFYGIRRKLQEIEDSTSFVTVKHLSARQVQNIEMPLPSLPEQRRIVDLLSRAEGIVRLRRETEKKAAELIPALFLDMFGDPATNPKGWAVARFGDVGVLDRGKSRHRPRDAAELYDGPYPFIQTGDVANSGGRITEHTTTYSEVGLAQSKLWKAGTLCITIAANIAKTGVLTFDACFPDSVVGFLPGGTVRTNFVQAWLSFLQPTLETNAPQAAQKNINLEILRNLPMIVPPLDLQTEFEDRCESVVGIQSQQSAATAKAQATFDALLAGAFSGGL